MKNRIGGFFGCVFATPSDACVYETKIKRCCSGKVSRRSLASVMKFAKQQKSSIDLFGVNKEKPGFFSYLVLLTLFKDLRGIGINKLKSALPSSYHMSNDSLTDNIKQIRRLLGNYGITKIKLRKPSKWHRHSVKVNLSAVPKNEKRKLQRAIKY